MEKTYGAPFPTFEKAWLAHVKKQPFPKELIPISLKDRKELAETKDKDKDKKKDEFAFGEFREVEELEARRWAHLGELMRERDRPKAAAEHFSLAWQLVKDRYESVSNQYALTLLELKRFDEAEGVLRGSLKMHPGSGPTSVHLGRILLRKNDYAKAREAYLDALAVNPFDPEIYLALYRCASATKDDALKERTQKALHVLVPQLEEKQIPAAAAAFAKSDDLSDVDLSTTETVADAGPAAPAGN